MIMREEGAARGLNEPLSPRHHNVRRALDFSFGVMFSFLSPPPSSPPTLPLSSALFALLYSHLPQDPFGNGNGFDEDSDEEDSSSSDMPNGDMKETFRVFKGRKSKDTPENSSNNNLQSQLNEREGQVIASLPPPPPLPFPQQYVVYRKQHPNTCVACFNGGDAQQITNPSGSNGRGDSPRQTERRIPQPTGAGSSAGYCL